MQDPILGNVLVVMVLLGGAAAMARGLFLMRTMRGLAGTGEVAERGRQRCMAWVVAGCMAVSIPALVGLVTTPPGSEPAPVHAPVLVN